MEMVRKQLYITAGQDRALKEEARALGVSEAELVRRAIDDLLGNKTGHTTRQRAALSDLLEHTRQLIRSHRLPAGFQFNREALYSDREQRQHRRGK